MANEPIAAGAGLRTAQGAQAEWRGSGARVALARSSNLQVLRFDGNTLQVVVTEGRIGIHLDAAEAAKTVEIDLPYGGVWLDAPGDYDIAAGDVHSSPIVQVFAGKARLGGGLDDRYVAAVTPDSFSDWWRSQDDNADLTTSRPWPEIAGIAALDAAGAWERDAKLGNVWYPSDVAAEWTPYRDGAWRFLPPWGWTWIASEKWGFAPSHYGRWAWLDGRWGWVPGATLDAADYSPAVVAFLGTAGIGLSRPGDTGSAVAWFPLAPGEKTGAAGDADGAYQNRRFATAVPRNTFTNGLPVANALVDDVPKRRFAEAPVILQSLDISPAVAAPKKPVARADTVVAAVAPEAASEPRPPYVVALRDAPPSPPVRQVQARPVQARVIQARDVRKRVRFAVAVVTRSRPLVSAPHSPHTRQHLAAVRGGA